MNAEDEKKISDPRTQEAIDKYKSFLEFKTGRKVEIIPNVEFADSDYLVYYDGKLSHYLEVKCRRNNFNSFPDTLLPLRKHSTAEHYLNATGVKTYFLAYFGDDILSILDLTKEPDKIGEQVARKDRSNDRDIYAFYDITRFTIIEL